MLVDNERGAAEWGGRTKRPTGLCTRCSALEDRSAGAAQNRDFWAGRERGPLTCALRLQKALLREGHAVQWLRRDDELFDESMASSEIHFGSAGALGDASGDVDEGLSEPLPFPVGGLFG